MNLGLADPIQRLARQVRGTGGIRQQLPLSGSDCHTNAATGRDKNVFCVSLPPILSHYCGGVAAAWAGWVDGDDTGTGTNRLRSTPVLAS